VPASDPTPEPDPGTRPDASPEENAADAAMEPAPRAHAQIRQRFPVGLVSMLALSLLGTLLYRTSWPALLDHATRDAEGLRHGQVWRLLTPVFVSADSGAVTALAVLFAVVVGVFAERRFGTGRFLVLWLGGAAMADLVGAGWQPDGPSISVAACGVLGGLATWWLRMRASGPVSAGLGVLLVAVLMLPAHDVHGVAMLTGMGLGGFVLRGIPAVYRGRVRG
jgi:membrane associated rhomboid family serine protease